VKSSGTNYYAYRHPSWVRLLINGQFYYATFLSLATHLTDEIEEAGSDIIVIVVIVKGSEVQQAFVIGH
jgi:hypothetical protein